MMKRILVPSDFSANALEALRFGVDIANISGGKVSVLNMIDLPVSYESAIGVQPYIFDASLLKDLEANAKLKFEKAKSMFAKQPAPLSFHVNIGSTVPGIKRFIKDNKIDLVVMGTQGASGVEEYLIGSNTEKIVRSSVVPVFAVRKAPKINSVKNIVFPSRLELNHTDFMIKLMALQDFFKATLHLLFINTPPGFRRDTDVAALQKEFVKHYKLKNITLNIRSDYMESEGIINFTKEIKADMIAMPTHGRKGLAHFFHSSIAENTVNHVDCPIWTYALKDMG